MLELSPTEVNVQGVPLILDEMAEIPGYLVINYPILQVQKFSSSDFLKVGLFKNMRNPVEQIDSFIIHATTTTTTTATNPV